MRVNSAKAMVSKEKYTPEMPKRKARKPITTPTAAHRSDRQPQAAHGPMP